MAQYDYDLIVVGSGMGGTIAAQQVAKAGKRVAIVELNEFGGSEAESGRVPIGALLHSASVYETAKHGSRFGIRSTTVGYNYPTIKAWKNLVVKRTGIHASEKAFLEMGINVIQGRAYFIDPHTITIGAARYSSKEFLIATGSESILPEVAGLSKSGFLTVAEATNLTRPPKKLAIIGSGQLACELAQLFAVFGTKVYIVDSGTRLLPAHEPEVSSLLETTFQETYSVSLLLQSRLEKVETTGLGRRLSVNKDGKQHLISVDEIILATAKKPTIDIGLENAGVQYDDGAIYTDMTLATSAKHIYAAGSCTGEQNTAHIAAYQGQIVANNILNKRSLIRIDYRAVPQAVFTNPEIASTGYTEQQLKLQGVSYNCVTVPLSVIAQANISDFSSGFVKVIASKSTGILLGATIVSPNASEMIHELTLAVQNHLSAQEVSRTMHIFPSWSEAIRVACSKLAKL